MTFTIPPVYFKNFYLEKERYKNKILNRIYDPDSVAARKSQSDAKVWHGNVAYNTEQISEINWKQVLKDHFVVHPMTSQIVFQMALRTKSQSVLLTITLGAFLLYCGMEYGMWTTKMRLSEVGTYESSNVGNANEIRPLEKSTRENLLECAFIPLLEAQQFMDYGKKKKHCKKLVSFGGPENATVGTYNDGQKLVCQDEMYKINSKSCVVLSFGIASDWTFDDAMGKLGCKVFSFDPTIGLNDHKRSENIQFFNLGIGNSKRKQPFANYSIEIDRYEGILQKLNLTNSVIDFLKIDVEGAEIDFFNDVFQTSPQLLDNVKQIAMELHPDPVSDNGPPTGRMHSYWTDMNLLECLGFKLLSWQPNMAAANPYKWRNRQESACYEVVWGRSL